MHVHNCWYCGVQIPSPDLENCGGLDVDEYACDRCAEITAAREEPDQNDEVHCCPDCDRPNQFGELCPSCEQEQRDEADDQGVSRDSYGPRNEAHCGLFMADLG